MKNTIILLGVLLAFLLGACSQTSKNTETPVSNSAELEISAPYELKVPPEDRNQACGFQSFVETPEGYYYGKDLPAGTFIYFCPRGGGSFCPLCSKPNCAHNDENCNAYVGRAFGYYDGALYGAAQTNYFELDVVRMNLDGTDHQKVMTLDIGAATKYGGYAYLFHHGKLFFWTDGTGSESGESYLIVLDLSDNSRRDYTLQSPVLVYSGFFKDKLYGVKMQQLDPDELEARKMNPDMPRVRELIEVDAATGMERTVATFNAPGFASTYFTDSTMYSYRWEADSYANLEPGKLNAGFQELDLNTGVVKDCGKPVDDIEFVLYDADYIYAMSFYRNKDGAYTRDVEEGVSYTLYLLSREYELVDQIELSSELGISVASDRIFLTMNDTILYYLDKSQIGSHNLTPLPIETVSGGRTPG